jgi:hypothetical protein
MSIGQIAVLTAIVGAFVVFATVLGWDDYRAQQRARRIRDQDRKDAAVTVAAAQGAATAQARWPQPASDRLQRVA